MEVKTRTSLEYGYPLEAINKLKAIRIKKLASLYIATGKLSAFDPSFDVISIITSSSFIKELAGKEDALQKIILSSTLKDNKNLKIEHIENAF